MKRLLIPASLVACLAVPAAAVAGPPAAKSDKREGVRECVQLLRAAETKANFVSLVKAERDGARTTARTAFKACVKERVAAAKQERKQSRNAAVEACRAEAGAPGAERGRPADPESRSAFGKCVASKNRAAARALDAEQRERSLNPAKACRADQKADPDAFAQAHGTKPNAFGKCVSAKAKAQAQADEQPAAQNA